MWIVIEKFGGPEYASIVMNEGGSNKIFDTEEEANQEVEECQDGIVVYIN